MSELILKTLYQELLGNVFKTLPKKLRDFHSEQGHAEAAGHFDIERGQNPIAKILASLLCLPPAGKYIPVHLGVVSNGLYETWTRNFDGRVAMSQQHVKGGLLVERAGPVEMQIRVEIVNGGIRFESVSVRIWRFSVPKILSPQMFAFVSGSDEGWHTEVEIKMSFIGRLVRYHGELNYL